MGMRNGMNSEKYLNYQIQKCAVCNEEWTQAKCLPIGDIPKEESIPDEYYVIEKDGEVHGVLKAYHRWWGFAET